MFELIDFIQKALFGDENMGITERREAEKEAIKKKIIDAANEILYKEGYENLSIRKIAKIIEYSPGIIYHYFNDKAEIVSEVVQQGYGNILKTLSEIPVDLKKPEKSIEEGLRAYIKLMLDSPEPFKAIVMRDVEEVHDKVNILKEGISKERKSIQNLCDLLKIGIEKKRFDDMDIELTAQILWTSTFGLLSRLIIEREISLEQRKRLIDHHFKILIKGLLKQ
jgi:AcrR family transcriptional regulator